MTKEEFLTGSVYIGGVGSPTQPVEAISSIDRLQRRPGDGEPTYIMPTKGYEGREQHVDRFLKSDHDFLLFVDIDMRFPPDALEKLRSHGRAFVTGRYIRRSYAPMMPIWFEDDPDFNWPMKPYMAKPPRGELVRLGATGWGCVLVHRSVFDAVRGLLKDEPFVLEDDMDVWPYSLPDVLEGKEKLRPLRGIVGDNIGSDIRFSYYARQAGFTLWGDASVECDHYVLYPLSPSGNYDAMSEGVGDLNQLTQRVESEVAKQRAETLAILRALTESGEQ